MKSKSKIRVGKNLDPRPIKDLISHIDFQRYSLEPREYPRKCLFTSFNKIKQINTEIQIKQKFKFVNHRKIRLNYLNDNQWVTFRNTYSNIDSPWLLVKFKDGNLIQLDIDSHENTGNINEHKEKRDKILIDVTSYLDSKKISYFITTSPGDIFFNQETNHSEILHGYYIWIKTKDKLSSCNLTLLCNNLINDIHKQTTHKIEHNWQSDRSRNTRLFGQAYVDLCTIKDKIIKREYHTDFDDKTDILQDRANYCFLLWKKLKPSNIKIKNNKTVSIKKDIPPDFSINTNIINPNAFFRFVGYKQQHNSIVSSVVRKYKGDITKRNTIIHECTQRFTEACVAGNFTDHTNNPQRMEHFIKRIVDYFIKNYDSNIENKIEEDYSPFKIDLEQLRDTFKLFSVPIHYQKIIIEIYNLCIKWNGYVAAKSIYGKNGVCSKKEWFKVKRFFIILKEHSVQKKKCRQLALKQTSEKINKKSSICLSADEVAEQFVVLGVARELFDRFSIETLVFRHFDGSF